MISELSLVQWDHLADPAAVEDDLTYGGVLVRTGLNDVTELQIGWQGHGTARSMDRLSSDIDRNSGGGDLTVALRRSVSGPGGPVAVHAFVTLPTGTNGIGAGDWSAGLLAPMEFKLGGQFELDLTPRVDAAGNTSGSCRHFAWGGVVGLSHPVGPALTAEAELQVKRDNDPAGAVTDARSALSLAWQTAKDWQVDFEFDLGLSSSAPRHSLLVGLAHRF